MGTRGLIAFKYRGKYYISYNHSDSYFTGLGRRLVEEIKVLLRKYTLDEIRSMIESITLVITSEHSDCQGSYRNVLKSGFMYSLNAYTEEDFVSDVFIEYSYVFDLDLNRFVTYTSDGDITDYQFDNLPDY